MSRVFHLGPGQGRAATTPRAPIPADSVPDAAQHGGRLLAGYLAPHPPQLIYADNPPQNEPKSQGGWEGLRWAYDTVRREIAELKPDVLIVHAPHWITMVGHHVNCVPNPRGISVEPIFPHIFRYHYDFRTDVDLAEELVRRCDANGLVTRAMRVPGVRVDYATIGALHMVNPAWDIPVVSISANNNPYFYADAELDEMEVLGRATREAVERTGRRAVVLASNSLSHLHFDREHDLPEDMSLEYPFNNHQYQADMKLLETIRHQPSLALKEAIPEHIKATESETKAGSLTWLLAALNWPRTTGNVLGYGTVIGTGNAVVGWRPDTVGAR